MRGSFGNHFTSRNRAYQGVSTGHFLSTHFLRNSGGGRFTDQGKSLSVLFCYALRIDYTAIESILLCSGTERLKPGLRRRSHPPYAHVLTGHCRTDLRTVRI